MEQTFSHPKPFVMTHSPHLQCSTDALTLLDSSSSSHPGNRKETSPSTLLTTARSWEQVFWFSSNKNQSPKDVSIPLQNQVQVLDSYNPCVWLCVWYWDHGIPLPCLLKDHWASDGLCTSGRLSTWAHGDEWKDGNWARTWRCTFSVGSDEVELIKPYANELYTINTQSND